MKRYAPVVLRVGLSLVFVWFGLNQLIFPDRFVGYLPDFALSNASMFLSANGIFEVVFGLMLLLGLFTRVSALFLAGHMLGIISSLGYNEIAVRDVGIMLATVSIVLRGPDHYSIDARWNPKNWISRLM